MAKHMRPPLPLARIALATTIIAGGSFSSLAQPARAMLPALPNSVLFSTGFETSDLQLTWVDASDSTTGARKATDMETSVRRELAHSGHDALLYSGNRSSPVSTSAFNKIFYLKSRGMTMSSSATLSYWILPLDKSAGANGLSSSHVSLDIVFADGSTLRNSGAVDQYGVRLSPRYQGDGGHLHIGKWNLITSHIGAKVAGRRIDRILVDYSQPRHADRFRGFIDDITLTGSTSSTASTPTPTRAAETSTSTPVAQATGVSTATPGSTATATTVPVLTPGASATALTSNGSSIALGVMADGAPSTISKMDDFNTLVYPSGQGHAAALNYFANWEDSWSRNFDGATMDAIYARHAIPFLTWGSCQQGVKNAQCADAAIAGGSFDTYLHQWAHNAASYGKPFYLRFDHEMNGGWYPWHPGSNGNTDASFVAMWQHVHDIFVQEGATKVRWVWCPNTTPGGDKFTGMYPGDAYVDQVCLDGYNWGTVHAWDKWHSFASEFQASYDVLSGMTNKPMIIGETASTELSGDKAAWITQALLHDVPALFPRIKAIMWFNANKETDWRVNSSPAALAAYQQVAASPLYQGSMP